MTESWQTRALVFLGVLHRKGLPSWVGRSILAFEEPPIITLVHAAGGEVLQRLPPSWQDVVKDSTLHLLRSKSNITSIAIDPLNARWVAAGDAEGMLRIAWRGWHEGITRRVAPLYRAVSVCYALPGGEVLATGSADGAVRLWRTYDGSLLSSSSASDFLHLLNDGNSECAGDTRMALLKEVRRASGRVHQIDPGITSVVSIGQSWLVTADAAGRLIAWYRRKILRPGMILDTFPRVVRSICVSTDGRWFAASASCFSIDGSHLVHPFCPWLAHAEDSEVDGIGSNGEETCTDAIPFRFTRVLGHQADPQYTTECEDAQCVAFHANSSRFPLWIVGWASHVITVRSLPEGDLTATLAGHQHVVRSVAVPSCGSFLVSAGGGSERRRLIVWPFAQMEEDAAIDSSDDRASTPQARFSSDHCVVNLQNNALGLSCGARRRTMVVPEFTIKPASACVGRSLQKLK